MKKILFQFVAFVAISFIGLACVNSDDFDLASQENMEMIMNSARRSQQKALSLAEKKIASIAKTTRASNRKVKSCEVYIAKPATRSAEETIEVSFYLINYEDNAGYALVSTDSRTTPVYAYSDEGNITAEDLQTHPGLSLFMEDAVPFYESEIEAFILDSILYPIEIPDTLDDGRPISIDGILCYKKTVDTTIIVGPLLTTKWDQESPFNRYCGDGTTYVKAGCVPIAAAQIMAYHEHPASHNGVTYPWDDMKSIEYYDYFNYHPKTAILISQIGFDAGTIYGEDESTTTGSNIIGTFQRFGYTCSNYANYDISTIISNLNNSKPVYVDGNKAEGGSGHAWVVDGYVVEESRIRYYYATPPYNLYKSVLQNHSTYYHCNWGLISYVNSNDNSHNNIYNTYMLDVVTGYDINRHMIYNIQPINN